MIRALVLFCVVLLSACTNHAPLPPQIPHIKFPKHLHVQQDQGGQRQDWVIDVQKERHALRWSVTDSRGNLVARQFLQDETWKADDLLPPNPDARELFAAVLFALTSNEEARFDYPGVVLLPHGRTLEDRWRVEYASEGVFSITLESGELKYVVSPVRGKASK